MSKYLRRVVVRCPGLAFEKRGSLEERPVIATTEHTATRKHASLLPDDGGPSEIAKPLLETLVLRVS